MQQLAQACKDTVLSLPISTITAAASIWSAPSQPSD